MQLRASAPWATLAAVPGSPLRIAILDDEPDFRRALARLLASHGFGVVPFESGAGLLAAASSCAFDCIVLDLNMPGCSGFDVLEALRATANPPPVIVVTGHDDPSYARRALALDAFACQHKPVRAPDLLDAIRRACGR